MTDFLHNLSTLSWWLGVVVVGLLLNVVAPYLKAPLDAFLSRFSSRRAHASEKRHVEREQRLSRLRNDPSEQLLAAITALRIRAESQSFLFFGAILMALSVLAVTVLNGWIASWVLAVVLITPSGLSILAWILALNDQRLESQTWDEIEEARHPLQGEASDSADDLVEL